MQRLPDQSTTQLRGKGNATRSLQAALLPPPFVQMPVPVPLPLMPMSSALTLPPAMSSAFYMPLSLPVGLPVGMPFPTFYPSPQLPRFVIETSKPSDTNKRKRSRQSPYIKPVRVVRPKVTSIARLILLTHKLFSLIQPRVLSVWGSIGKRRPNVKMQHLWSTLAHNPRFVQNISNKTLKGFIANVDTKVLISPQTRRYVDQP